MKALVRMFSRIGIKYFSFYVTPLKETIKKSNLSMLYDIYIGKMILAALVTFFGVLVAGFVIGAATGLQFALSLIFSLIAALVCSVFVMVIFQTYPFQVLRANRRSIETNMPFAINHIAAISSSGVSPYVMFKLMSNIKEYGEISKECARVVRNIDIFGMAITTSVKNVANRTPSGEFKKFLLSTVSIIETGGNLQKYLESASKESMFEYKLKRESYLQTLSMYADIYTAVLIAAPLFFVSVLSIMALVGGQVLGLDVPTALRLGIYGIIPIMNLAFLAFIHYTQPSV